MRPMPDKFYLEQTALLDRIRFYETSARYGGGDRQDGMFGLTDEHLAFAQARLEHINGMIAHFEAA
jgi:hypothetical protein